MPQTSLPVLLLPQEIGGVEGGDRLRDPHNVPAFDGIGQERQ